MSLSEKIQRFVREHQLLQAGDRILAAVSGGVDSVVMLDVLLAMRDEWKLEIVVAHVNYQLRGEESDGDEEFVGKLAADRGLQCFVRKVDGGEEAGIRKQSIQETARDIRYEFFEELRGLHGLTKIATAHNADDNAETVLLNLSRGGGVQGLTGIPIARRDIPVIRPMLGVFRSEVEEYAAQKGLAFRTDSSNAGTEYTRNFIRHSVIPQLKEVNPNVVQILNRTADVFRGLEQFLTSESNFLTKAVLVKKESDEVVLDLPKLKENPQFLQEYFLLLVARMFGASDAHSATVRSLLRLTEAETGSRLSVAKDVTAFRDRDRLVLRRGPASGLFCYRVEPNKSYSFGEFKFSSMLTDSFRPVPNGLVEFVDADRLGQNLVLRSWNEGDWFCPLGMNGRKKLSDFFVDVKVPLYEKHRIPVLESDGAIVWVCGKRIDERFRVSEATKNILRLEYSPLNS